MDIAENIKLNLSDGNKIASSNDKNTYNNNFNILELIDIQNKKIFDNKTFSENYADFISYIGQTTKNIQNIQDSQEKINKQLHLEYENKIEEYHMTLSTRSIYRNCSNNIVRATSEFHKLTSYFSAGKRVIKASDNPKAISDSINTQCSILQDISNALSVIGVKITGK
ncbi:hypothetical protein GQX74_015772 [Glossina fuscipes]|nr:hypothetical protein GQX74_015772 [Glossina fuscipes]